MLLQNCRASAGMFRSIALSANRWWLVGSGVAVEWRCTSIAAGKDGKPDCPMDFTGVDVFNTTRNGSLITSMVGYFDAAGSWVGLYFGWEGN